jgi:hypothetical protein
MDPWIIWQSGTMLRQLAGQAGTSVGRFSMNYLVPIDADAGELEKILSGVKTMVMKDSDPDRSTAYSVGPGDGLYFLRDKDECALRVKATVVIVLPIVNGLADDLSQTLKEMQPRLQLAEEQYNHWSSKQQVELVEFDSAQKIGVIHVAPDKIKNRSAWIAFEEISQIAEEETFIEQASPHKER